MENLYTSKTKNYKTQTQFALAVFMLLAATFYSYSQVRVNFEPRTSIYTPSKTIYNVKGDFTMMGNTNLTLATYGDNTNNGGNDMKYVDIDNDVNTLNSSSATLQFSQENNAIPECSNVVYAGLYWSGRAGSSNTFTVTKSVPNGNFITQTINTTDIIYSNESIDNTDYSLNISSSGGTYRYTFTTTGSGNKVEFIYRTSGNNETLHVSVNNGPESAVSTSSINDDNAYLSAPYQVFSDSNYTLEVTRLRLNWTDRAYVNVNYTETIPALTTITKNYDKRKVSIKGPTAGSYTQLTANATDIYYPTSSDDYMYSAYAEITDYVRTNGLGEYFVADLALREGDPDGTGYYGGWGMVVVYENTKMKWRDVTVFDGHAYVVSGNNNQYTIGVNGFNSTQNGDVNVKLGVMGGEGDVGFSGDTFQIENRNSGTYTSLSHSGNNTNNFFKSSINTGGNPRNPQLLNNTGVDISMFDINNTNNAIINNNQTSTSFKYFTNGDTYSIYNVTFAVDAYIPESEGILSANSINGVAVGSGNLTVQPGDTIEYGVEIRNRGTEAITNGRLVIPIPFTSSFVPGSISYNEYNPLFQSSPPYFDPNEGATGAVVWDMAFIPLNPLNLAELMADISFEITSTTDCSILVNNNCTPKIVIVGGNISGTGNVSQTNYSLPLIQGYQEAGVCQGEPNTAPIEIDIDSEQYILDNCTGVSVQRDFFYCSFEGNTIPVSEVSGNFPPGTQYYDSFPITPSTIQYNQNNPFPATIGVSTYYAIPPGQGGCNYIFTIEVNDILTTPTTSNVTYCLGETALPLTATTSESNYILLYYTNNNPATPGQVSITPSTSTAGVFTYYVSEGPSNSCTGERTPITVTVLDPITITLDSVTNTGCSGNDVGAINISVSGGTGNYTYTWDDASNSSTQDLNGLPAGTYTVTVNDVDANCSATDSFEIIVEDTAPPTITAPTDVSLEGCAAEDITNGGLTALAFSETEVTITEAEYLAEGGTFLEDNVASITYQDIATGSCPITIKRNFTITDNCEQSAAAIQTFTITSPAVVVNTPDNATADACDYASQAEVDTAFNTWLSGFTVSGGCNAIGDYGTPTAPLLCEGGTTTVTYTITDLCNPSTIERTFSITAPEAVVVNTPDNATADACDYASQAEVDTAFNTWLNGFTVSGGCNATGDYGTPTAPLLCEGGTTTVTYTISDLCNPSTIERTFSITAPEAVVVNTPDNATADACDYASQAEVDTAFNTWLNGFTVSGGCNATGDYGTPTAPLLCEGGTTTVTYIISDLCNPSTIERTFSITAPDAVVMNTPDNATADACDYASQAEVDTAFNTWLNGFTVSGGCNATGDYGTPTAPLLCEGGTTTVTYTITDLCNPSTIERTFSITAPDAVVVNTPDNATADACIYATQAEVDAAFNTWLNGFSVSGGCNATGDYGTPTAPLLCEGGTTTVTYTVTDVCNTSSVERTFSITAPEAVVVNTPDNATADACDYASQAEVDTAFNTWLNGFTVSGGCNATGDYGTPTAPLLCEGGTTTVTYTISDLCNPSTVERTFSITAPEAVVVNTPDNATADACDYASQAEVDTAFNTWLNGFTVSGGCNATGDYGTPTAPLLCEGGTTTVTYTITDLCNPSTIERTFSITAPEAVVVNTPDNATADACDYASQAEVDAAFNTWLNGFSVSGGCNATGDYGTPTAPLLCEGGTTTVTYTISDLCNPSTIERTFSITAPEALVITNAATNIDIECDGTGNNGAIQEWLDNHGYATVSDNCSEVTWTNNYGGVSSDCANPIEVTFTATDACGNFVTTTASYSIIDTVNPVITVEASPLTVECDGNGNTADLTDWLERNGGASATDDCSAISWSHNYTGLSDDCGATGSASVTFTATDACGNTSTTMAIFTIEDTTAPVLDAAPADITVECDAVPTASATDLAATDNCDADIIVTYLEERANGNCDSNYTLTRTWTATDSCGNTASEVQVITVQDTTAPVLDAAPADITVECDAVPTASATDLAATDNCDADIIVTYLE
ncbi:hypothetical protein ACFPH8_10625, partial [Bizionia hallyeonensis]